MNFVPPVRPLVGPIVLALLAGCDASPPPLKPAPTEATKLGEAKPVKPALPKASLALPSDPKGTCAVTATEFATWFPTGAVTPNGEVTPADSVNFSDSANCAFYQWSERMFLWLLSPAPPSYGQKDAHVLNSDVFFDVSPPDGDGNRTFLPHAPNLVLSANLIDTQLGPNGLHTVKTKDGRLFEVIAAPASPKAQPLVLDATGGRMAVTRIEVDERGATTLFNASGAAIRNSRPIVPAALAEANIAVKVELAGKVALFDKDGNELEVEQAMADGKVLMAQNHSLVYYTIAVNDVFAWMRTGHSKGTITPAPTKFPTTQADLDKIVASLPAGTTLPDAVALAVEIKGAWVEAAGLADPASFLHMKGTIPDYDQTDPKHWKVKGTREADLALVAIHVVGSTKGHPEMIWATFEHVANAPNEAYSFTNTGGATTAVPRDTSGTWTFTSTASTGPFNQAHMHLSGTDIVADGAFTISPSDTLRMTAWGGASNSRPNPVVGTTATASAGSNAEVIDMNNNIRGMLLGGDLRGSYVMTGASWTIGGNAPTGPFRDPAASGSGNEVGTSQLSNTTMETYTQGSTSAWDADVGCFACHDDNTLSVSHVYGDLKPL